MRIPFPERVPINRVAIFAVALFVIQMAEGTELFFSVGCVVFILIAGFAFNAAGGLTRASGAYVFFYSMLVVIVGLCYKAFLGEPAQSNLVDPHTDIEVYVGGITALLGTVIVSRRFSRKTGLLQDILKESGMHRSSVGCILFGFVGGSAIALLGESANMAQSAFGQLNQLIPLGVIIGVMYEIRRSGGTRSTNLPVLLGIGYAFYLGVAGFSKQGMLTPLYCWFLPVCALRYRLSVVQVFSVLMGVFVIFHYMVPFAQYGRGLVPEGATVSQRVEVAVSLLEHLDETRRLYLESEELLPAGAVGEYYNTPQGFWDRLQFISIDDPLINITDQGKVIGFAPITESFVNAVPHFIWPNKPHPKLGGNSYAHEINGQAQGEGDISTGISFSPTAEAFHMARWVGIFVGAPILWFLLFVVFDSLFGDLRASPWGLLAIAMISHTAPEGALSGMIYLLCFGTEILVFCGLFATWVAPVFATAILGPDRGETRPRLSFQPDLASDGMSHD